MNSWLIQYKTDQITVLQNQIDTLQQEIYHLQLSKVADAVCLWHSVDMEAFKSKCRKWQFGYARMMYTYICIRVLKLPIGSTTAFINRNRTTSNTQIKAHINMMQTDEAYRTTFNKILKHLELWEEHSE